MLSRNPRGAGRASRGTRGGPAPAEALAGRDAVVHLAGEHVAQRWSDDVKRRIRDARDGTRNLVAGTGAADPRPRALVSSSAVGYYGPHGDERVTRTTAAGNDFLAGVSRVWEGEARARPRLGLRVACPHRRRARRGRRRAGEDAAVVQARRRRPRCGRPSVHALDPPGRRGRASTSRRSTARPGSGPVNASAPEPVTNKEFSKRPRPRAAPPRVRPGARASPCGSSTANGRDRHQGPARGPRAARSSSATRSRTRTSTRRCARAGLTAGGPRAAGRGLRPTPPRGLWRRCHGSVFHAEVARGAPQPDHQADGAEEQAGAEAAFSP